MQTKSNLLSLTLGAMLVGSLVTGVVLSLPGVFQGQVQADSVGAINRIPPNLEVAQDLSSAFRRVADSLRPTVVSIRTMTSAKTYRGRTQGIPPQFEPFFGRQPRLQRPAQTGLGSGVIVRSNGYILTNFHVIKGADQIHVGLSDGSEYLAKVVGTDPETDLAVIKIDQDNLASAPLGDSVSTRVGDWVLAIGSPFGLQQSVTAGIISAKHRTQRIIADDNGFEDFLQTDAAINPGNSGGPLVNLRGEVVGINTAIESKSGGSNGIGFAIPTTIAIPVVKAIIESGSVRRGFLGAQVGDVDRKTSEKLQLDVNEGALIITVLEGQPAAEGGLKPGDVVTAINGKPVRSGTELRKQVAFSPPGSVLSLDVLRSNQNVQLNIKIVERNDDRLSQFDNKKLSQPFGAQVRSITPQIAAQFGLEMDSGLIVTNVRRGGLADRIKLQNGDVITRINGEPANVARLVEGLERSGEVEITYLSKGRRVSAIIVNK